MMTTTLRSRSCRDMTRGNPTAPMPTKPSSRSTRKSPAGTAKPAGDSRNGSTRKPLARIHTIHTAILKGGLPNCSTLATLLGVERKTIQRDISFMRDQMGLPLEYDDQRHGYRYTKAVGDFPVMQTSSEELAALFLARNAVEAIRGSRLAEVLGTTFAKLTAGMLGKVRLTWSELDEAISRKGVRQDPRQVRLFGDLAKAVLDQHEISFTYHKPGGRKPEARRVQPLHLGEVEGGWYLIAHDLDRAALRNFALPRMSALKVSARRFDRPPGFVASHHLRDSFGVWHVADDPTRHTVRIELKGYAAQLAQERRWHPTQETTALNPGGSRVEIRFEVGRLEEVLRWVLSFGRHAKVLAPPELAAMVREEVRAMR
jgi:predicted DNA-binding transcriptional regulator YafY